MYDEEGNYLVQPLESWTWIWRQEGREVHRETATYQGEPSRCWGNPGIPCGHAGGLWAAVYLKCAKEVEYSVELEQNGFPLGRKTFRPTRFRPMVDPDELRYTASIQPKLDRSGIGEVSPIALYVTDDLDCGEPLADVKVKLSSHIQPGTNGHAHFASADEVGSGEFQNTDGASTLNSATEIEGKTRANGFYATAYQAKDWALSERIEVELLRPATADDPELAGPTTTFNLDIKLSNLINVLDLGGSVLTTADGGTCPHEPQPRHMTFLAASLVVKIATEYQLETEAKISVNDASLPWGGIIDNKHANGKDASCHVSHRKGIDIDINRVDSTGHDIATATSTFGGRLLTRLEWITIAFQHERAFKVPEEPLHYRFQ
ncbi:MAG: hypothetical protein HYV16_09120 [Gammaproteobacteria bacterium]|nr:hypothetical protein [Gammaproteobacteria bacterium]